MNGPRDLRRGAKRFERPNPAEAIGTKSYFTYEAFGRGFALNIHRRGQPVESVLVDTEGELNRLRQTLTESGLIGWNARAA
ncbi:hypothetical protein [Mesorhizobium argentiipisi]|uniref:Uncharacterized protein n=1 Tax=Mesorhizobium argentiipisi TaxID=3015175 RepID=A0ABU8KDQ9_9HYPH